MDILALLRPGKLIPAFSCPAGHGLPALLQKMQSWPAQADCHRQEGKDTEGEQDPKPPVPEQELVKAGGVMSPGSFSLAWPGQTKTVSRDSAGGS